MNFSRRNTSWLGGLMLCAASVASTPASAERIANPVAVFSGIDKITGRITTFDVYINETVQFGALQVTPKICYSRDDTEAQRTDAFVEVDEITLDRKIRRIFSGWMFADSPGLNAVEHAIYDVWLKECKATSDVPPPDGVAAAHPDPVPDAPPQQASDTVQQQTQEVGTSGSDAATSDDPTVQPLQVPGQTDQFGQTVDVPPLDAPETIPGDGIQGQPLPGDPLQGDTILQGDVPPAEIPQGEPVPSVPGVKPGAVGLF